MLFLSIHPAHVQAILDGRKTVELRKRRPRATPGTVVVIYATTPRCEVVATAVLDQVECASPDRLWPRVRKIAAVTRSAFDDYFQNCRDAVGIHLTDVRRLESPILLSHLRAEWKGFHPPQQFRYLDDEQQILIAKRSSARVSALAPKQLSHRDMIDRCALD